MMNAEKVQEKKLNKWKWQFVSDMYDLYKQN